MDRVVRWIDRLIEDGTIESAVIQAANFAERPRYAQSIGVVSPDEIEDLMRTASRVITHGGPGTILQALSLGRSPIVIARDPARGEHVDAHQLRFVAWLAERLPITPVTTLHELRGALATPEPHAPPRDSERKAVRRVREILTSSPEP